MATTTPIPLIRDLRRSDVTALVALGDVLRAADSTDSWRARLADSAIVALGAEQDGVLVGYAAGAIRTSFGLEPAGWIEAFGVSSRSRGFGVGRLLASELFARFRIAGARHAYTLVPVHDLALPPFFHDLGFREEPLVPLGRTL